MTQNPEIIDIHTHGEAPRPKALISVSPENFNPFPGQFYSVGIHPWDSALPSSVNLKEELRERILKPEVLAIGECGIDKLKGAPLFRQMQIFKMHIDLSEELGKPLIIHDVKAHDVILGLRKDLGATRPWAIHGFRAKPSVAKMFADAGIYLSFGENFNPESLMASPRNLILAETDKSSLPIEEIIKRLSESCGEDLTNTIIENTGRFLLG